MAPAREPDYYAILDVPETASTEEITRAYRRLVRQAHPDTNSGGDPRQLQDAIDAYQVIGDPARRRAYDASRRRRQPVSTGGTRIPVRRVQTPEPRPAQSAGRARSRGQRPCPNCGGSGLISRRSNQISIRQECRSCDGSGRV